MSILNSKMRKIIVINDDQKLVSRQRYYAKILREYFYKELIRFNHDYAKMESFLVEKFIDFDSELIEKLQNAEGITASYHIASESLAQIEIENGGKLPEQLQNIMNEIILEIM